MYFTGCTRDNRHTSAFVGTNHLGGTLARVGRKSCVFVRFKRGSRGLGKPNGKTCCSFTDGLGCFMSMMHTGKKVPIFIAPARHHSFSGSNGVRRARRSCPSTVH